MIGKFGEGFKVAALVLLRGFDQSILRKDKDVAVPEDGKEWAPKTMHIINHNLKWTFSLKEEPLVPGARCLHWKTEPITPNPDGEEVVVTIGNITEEEWEGIYTRKLLRLSPLRFEFKSF